MLTCMQEGMPADAQDRKGWPWWKAKKWALHIAGRLFSRYGDPKMHADSGPSKAFAQLWKAHCSSQFHGRAPRAPGGPAGRCAPMAGLSCMQPIAAFVQHPTRDLMCREWY